MKNSDMLPQITNQNFKFDQYENTIIASMIVNMNDMQF